MMAMSAYEQIEANQRSGYNRTCINGRTTGCGKCVGYCQYDGHPGYLTELLRKKHNCIEKECFHYIPKPSRERSPKKEPLFLDTLLASAIQLTTQMEGLRIISVTEQAQNHWQFNYVTISNEYSLHDVAQNLERDYHGGVTFKKLNYSFERCVQLIFAG